jgi:hypothetical protein
MEAASQVVTLRYPHFPPGHGALGLPKALLVSRTESNRRIAPGQEAV